MNLTETKLSKDEVSQSNRLFFNDRALEDVLPDVTVSENHCSSCSDLGGDDTNCPTVVSEGKLYEEIPAALIRKAALAAAGLEETTEWK